MSLIKVHYSHVPPDCRYSHYRDGRPETEGWRARISWKEYRNYRDHRDDYPDFIFVDPKEHKDRVQEDPLSVPRL